MELLAISERELELFRELVTLRARRVALARDIAGFTDTAAERLERAERSGQYPSAVLASERPRWQRVADAVRSDLRVLTDTGRCREHPAAREALHSLFEAHGEALLSNGVFLRRLGDSWRLSLVGEFHNWKVS